MTLIKFCVSFFTCIVEITTFLFSSHCKPHVCVFKDGDTHVGVEDTDDAEEMDIGWYLFTFANLLTVTLAAGIITEFWQS